ncbi:transposase [Streptosporangium sp. NPDC000396]|uniref:transposase n=1 Tax=Streptosporangium sp. NPDC000396 TaxID=3366185 RepID=UPI00367BFC61
MTRRFDLTDAQWAVLEPLLPVPKRSGRPWLFSKRQLIDGIRRRVRVGVAWRDVPACYGSWPAVYALLRRFQREGTWQQILTTLQMPALKQISWHDGVYGDVL